MMKITIAAFCMLPLFLVGCGEDSVVERPEGSGQANRAEASADSENPLPSNEDTPEQKMDDSSEPRVDGKVIDTEKETESTPPPTNEPERSPPGSSSSNSAADPVISGEYGLSKVDGKGLPAVTDTRPDCQIEVLSGHLTIHSSNRFDLQTATRETCNGEVTIEDVWEASGTVSTGGSSLRFEGSSGDAFGRAVGALDSGVITIRSISTEGGEQKVDWRFVERGSMSPPTSGGVADE